MKKLKITLLVFYVLMIIILIYESAIPESLSVKEHNFFKKIVNNISRVFVKTKYVDATEIVVNNDLKEYYYINDTLTLNASVKPDDASYKELSFSSTNTNVLTVDNTGYIEFLSEGNASVIIKQKDCNLEKEVLFVVKKKEKTPVEVIEPSSIELVCNYNSLDMGNYTVLGVKYDRDDVTDKNITFTSSNKNVANLMGNVLYALNEGVATITVTHNKTKLSSSIDIEIKHKKIVAPEYFRIVGDDLLYANDKNKHTYSVEVDPDASPMYKLVFFEAIDETGNKTTTPINISWTSGVAKVSGYGFTTINAYNYDFDSDGKVVRKNQDSIIVEVKNILPKYSLSNRRIVLGNPYKLSINPYNSSEVTYSKYEYKSSDESIASIDNLGNITPHKKGKVMITVRVDDGMDFVEESFELTVDTKVMEDNMGKKSFSKFVRKGLSHFMGFVVFGFISSFMFLLFIPSNYEGNKKLNIVVTIVNGFVFACLTEFIQLFAIGRTSQFMDIGIDYLGYMIAVTISFAIILTIYLIKKIKKNKTKTIDNENN